MDLKHYRYAGLRVASALELPEWSAFAAAPAPPDVTISFERAASPLEASPLEAGPLATDLSARADGCAFFVPEVGRFDIRRSPATIRVTALPEAEMRTVRVFVLGSAWGALCHLTGLLVIHAGVAQIGDRAIAFCGPSGAGKSSLTAWLASRGARLVADDLCRVELSGTGLPVVYPGAPRVKLWREAADALGWAGEPLERDHARMDKYHYAAARAPSACPAPLAGICALAWGEPRTERLYGMDALRALASESAYRPDLMEATGTLSRHWQRCAELAARIPVWRHSRPRDWEAMAAGMEGVLRLFEQREESKDSHYDG